MIIFRIFKNCLIQKENKSFNGFFIFVINIKMSDLLDIVLKNQNVITEVEQ